MTHSYLHAVGWGTSKGWVQRWRVSGGTEAEMGASTPASRRRRKQASTHVAASMPPTVTLSCASTAAALLAR
jgi:hypothetical protein